MEEVLQRLPSRGRPRENRRERVELNLITRFVAKRTFICEAPYRDLPGSRPSRCWYCGAVDDGGGEVEPRCNVQLSQPPPRCESSSPRGHPLVNMSRTAQTRGRSNLNRDTHALSRVDRRECDAQGTAVSSSMFCFFSASGDFGTHTAVNSFFVLAYGTSSALFLILETAYTVSARRLSAWGVFGLGRRSLACRRLLV